ncbi:MAG: PTS sugar transporter subunit IIA [Selenomonadaceae bacterium]|nr:PTS sugar transporter subunit IIA [Selenomonadaceae bacterium]
MKITKFIPKGSVALNMNPSSKQEAIDMLIDLLASSGVIKDKKAIRKDVLAREAGGSTGLGNGLATPHAQNNSVKKPAIAAITVPNGVEFDSIDGKPARLLFLFAAPEKADDKSLTEMGRLAVLLMDPDFKESLIKAKTTDEFLKLIDAKESEREASEAKSNSTPAERVKILAVTACPTGISSAHMAAEALKQAAWKRSIAIHVETRGAEGVYDELSDDDIKEADAIIVAASANVPMYRFNGKRLIQTAVVTGINKPDQLLERVLSGHAPIHHQDEDDASFSSKILKKIKSIFS